VAEVKATNVHWHEGIVSRDERWKELNCKGVTLWFTGLSASGKSTIACALEQVLLANGVKLLPPRRRQHPHGAQQEPRLLSLEDREENIRRIGEVAKLFADSGCITLTSFISPYIKDRDNARKLHEEAGLPFLEIFVDAPIDVCEKRDPKGLYKKARAGEIKGFTGIDDPYEAPQSAELTLKPPHSPSRTPYASASLCSRAAGSSSSADRQRH
jgi:adenylylsulfate kinase